MYQLYRLAEFGQLSAGIFHDLLNPLSLIALSIADLEKSLSQQKSTKSMTTSVQSCQRIQHFISIVRKQLLNSDCETAFSIKNEIENSIVLLSHKGLSNGVSINFQTDVADVTFGNHIKFQQVVVNLISNAIDSYRGIIQSSEEKEVVIKLSRKNNFIELSIRDRGCGIPRVHQEKIFDPFFTTKSYHSNMGIGLSQVKHIIEKDFDGSIKAKSTEGNGTCFLLYFPLKQAPRK
jgi:C4-dicarboxylate-specific signal transduction histidine kinase